MSLQPFFSSSSKVWDSIEWVFGIEECGYAGWEISADGNYRMDNPDNVERIREVLGSTTLDVSVHAPYSDLNLASLNYPIYRESIRQMSRCVEAAAEFTDRVTIHPGYLSPAAKLVPEHVWDLHKAALAEIGAVARDVGVLATLENMPDIPNFFCQVPDELFGMADGIEGVGITLDVGHAHTMGMVDAFLRRIGEVDHVHIHDNDGTRDAHLALGEGTIDWKDVGSRVAASYSGICVVEGRNLDEARTSLEAFRGWFS
ncbi:MAG TPA: sugar phosphate isomerase/epimerase [Methanoculleus sp.]|nr:sugar phosphate isomerase/epimerase [Methanoculleus sp.]